jgi:xylulokinase
VSGAASELLLGIDVGTSSTKGVLATPAGQVVAEHIVEHELSIPRPGWAEHDAEAVWWGDVVAVCRELLAGGRAAAVGGVAVSGIGPCFCPARADGRPLRPAILYGIDTRAAREIDDLHEQFGRDAVLERTGSVLTSQAVGPKLLWMRRNEPDAFAATRFLLPAASFVVQRLTGEYVIDTHCASGFNPLFDVRAGAWIAEWADAVLGEDGPPLPRVLQAGDRAGEVSRAAAEATGLRAGTPVAAGTIDAAAEALSVGVVAPGELMLMYGSTMFLILVVPDLSPDARMWGTQYLFPGTFAIAGGMATSGLLTGWMRSLLQVDGAAPSYGELVDEAARRPPGAGGLVVLPYFSGERTPIHDPLARGVIAGLSLSSTRGDVYRAMLEGTAFGVRHNLETMAEMGARIDRVVAVGGGTRGSLWPRIVSDVCGIEQEIPRRTVGAALGDCLLAGLAAGLVERDTGAFNSAEATVVPDAAAAGAYEELWPVYRGLYRDAREHLHALARSGGA